MLLFVACKAKDSQVVNEKNLEVYYTKVLGNKKNKQPFVLFEVIIKESIPKNIEFISLIFNEEVLEISQIKNNQVVAYWYESENKKVSNQKFNFVYVTYKEGITIKKIKLPLQPQKPIFEPMAPKTKKNE
jgi:hypothetical protein